MSTIEKALAKQKKAAQDNKSNIEAQDISLKESNDATSAEISHQIIDTQTALKSSTSTKTSRANKEVITLNGEHLTERGFIFSANSAHHIQEEFRHIKRKLINNAFGPTSKTLKHSNLIMVSSSNPNEGKTFISINLALSIALEQDKTVLLVDADVLRPSIHRELEFESKQGLLEYLLDEVPSLSDVIYNTSIDNLKLIPAGKPHHLTNELLASAKMASLAEELAQRYPDRIVIFDCPPILGVTETPVLSSLVGQAVVVVEESKTKLDSVKKAVAQLNEDIAVGFVMNKTIRSKKDEYGYYGYGYGKKS
ncbi:XrtA-associated tyrosine autokinase [Colwellia sp. 4_MG-2023]|uniref:XrtA-associated tyrosine autokinase n=1 Tax=unclassified Colwellia TaxID=196834 RepID=UPI001C09E6C9|nr:MULTISPECIES: XrtA-associated tyrosine autokinase [unclassified Colwellia]MBU2924951.1 XrtA-associated tyrosine autokinase [Colwellia sp. C2M11]MDO6506850.1 XrtA-associated tyrosine autokinase [Colwellia sp. 5_MG-2023]MDO6555775.1 XrtA-associated tyrosine autokinase [Colwellia sp. 4_MG-2023]MDO6652816.1 XrtA-associated tyrosine autokinase [Colwellia sp. 3_MG-2023]MDO6665819.1 XrtA-associated tyrosine autokinase [Colwellia sp. 2_MG-2023]